MADQVVYVIFQNKNITHDMPRWRDHEEQFFDGGAGFSDCRFHIHYYFSLHYLIRVASGFLGPLNIFISIFTRLLTSMVVARTIFSTPCLCLIQSMAS